MDKDKGRAMVSLGPLNENRHCAFECAWCYVQDDFESYASLEVDNIIDYLRCNQNKYKIVYVSGDTDSFAPPRTGKGLNLLYKIVTEIGCDLLFTTRATFSKEHCERLKQIVEIQTKQNKMLYACMSITRLSDNYAYLEPNSIPSPSSRIETLKNFKELGFVSVLAMRPLLPVVNVNDYLQILDQAKNFVDIVLGEAFYFIRGKTVEKRVFPNGILKEWENDIVKKTMDFDNNKSQWDVWQATDHKEIIQTKCNELDIVFSMYSDDAIKKFLAKKQKLCMNS